MNIGKWIFNKRFTSLPGTLIFNGGNMKIKIIFSAVAAIVLASFASPALAQIEPGILIGPQVGFHKAQDADDGKVMGGLAMRFKLTPGFGIEGSVNYRQEEFGNALTVRSWPVMASALIYPLPMIYGAIGAGWYNTKYEVELAGVTVAEDRQQESGWHVGGGAEVPLGTMAKLTGDIRWVFLNYDFEDVPDVEVDRDFYVVTVGFLFGL
jgi:hypothetical protein